jgi:nucleotide-binding universal stress UspA family protein
MRAGSGPVVCGVDFSDSSKHALQFAHGFAARLGQPLVVVSAIDPLIAEAAAVRMGPGTFTDRAQRDLEGFAKEAAASGGTAAPSMSVRTAPGSPDKELLEAAATAKAGVIVVGTEGLGRARRFVFGSTTLRVMRGTHRPVLAVPPPLGAARSDGTIQRIVCGIDFSDPSRAAAAEAVALARHLKVPVTLAHAVPRLTMPSIWDVMMAPTDDERQAQARTNLKRLAAAFGAPEPALVVAVAEPHELMAQEAAAGPGTLLVLGLGDLSGHRPGSTAMRIMAETHLPVLAVPAQK